MSEIESYLVPYDLLFLLIAFTLLRFENQRWIRAIARGKVGTSPIVPLFVNVTGLLALLVLFGFYAVIIWKAGIVVALATIIANTLATIIFGFLISIVVGDSFFVWLLATLALWPTGWFLVGSTYENYLG
ncbi:hypothetical protein [Antarcticimicrobium luteum]|uniref:Uncharacterized protein n=1 Tax=Antarcticimicrobium luteum TaxID=2547397 RepID=A0A4R5VEN7_9RHOB|nr:hypothetical protein [Antarcticimicrobium luteum]TDK50783.1 hypothetical protein E1832_05205 [Antarcticimicrobium luteum]